MTSIVALVPTVALGTAAGLHAAWGLGSSFPATSRVELARAVTGTETMPPLSACLLVAASLAASAAIVGGLGGRHRLASGARLGVAAVLGARGLTGITGNTAVLLPWTPTPSFERLDRRGYGPVCLLLGASIIASATLDVA